MKNLTFLIVGGLVLGLAAGPAGAALTFDLSVEFSGSQSPAGSAPWLRATFVNDGANTVKLTLTSFLTASEFVDGQAGQAPPSTNGWNAGWIFNLNPAMNPNSLTITPYSVGSAPGAQWNTGANAFSADGDGLFDIIFVWPTPSLRFGQGAGTVATFKITGAGLTESDFNFLSAPHGGLGPFPTAAHVQGIFDPSGPPGNASGSGWVTVPAPGAVLLGAIGVGMVAWIKRRYSAGPVLE